jgi:hypothetical protein
LVGEIPTTVDPGQLSQLLAVHDVIDEVLRQYDDILTNGPKKPAPRKPAVEAPPGKPEMDLLGIMAGPPVTTAPDVAPVVAAAEVAPPSEPTPSLTPKLKPAFVPMLTPPPSKGRVRRRSRGKPASKSPVVPRDVGVTAAPVADASGDLLSLSLDLSPGLSVPVVSPVIKPASMPAPPPVGLDPFALPIGGPAPPGPVVPSNPFDTAPPTTQPAAPNPFDIFG